MIEAFIMELKARVIIVYIHIIVLYSKTSLYYFAFIQVSSFLSQP